MADLIDPFSVPRIGVAVLVENPITNKVLLLQRHPKSAHGAGKWGAPGGHWHVGETLAAGGARELEEETGLLARMDRMFPLGMTEDAYDNGRSYITVFFRLDARDGLLNPGLETNREPDKALQLAWIDNKDVPKLDLFLSLENLLRGPNAHRDALLYVLQRLYEAYRC